MNSLILYKKLVCYQMNAARQYTSICTDTQEIVICYIIT